MKEGVAVVQKEPRPMIPGPRTEVVVGYTGDAPTGRHVIVFGFEREP